MIIVGGIFIIILASFTAVLLFGAPYLPTLGPQVEAALKLADLQNGDTLLELGCGDGKVVLAAAKQGIRVVGYELNPILAGIAWLRTRRYHHNVRIVWGDFWRQPWPEAQAIFVFLLPRYMQKLDTKVAQYHVKPVKLVSFAFEVPHRHPTKASDGVFLYQYR